MSIWKPPTRPAIMNTSTKNIHVEILNVQSLAETFKVYTLSTENVCDGKSNRKKKRRGKSKKVTVKDVGQRLGQNNIDAQLINNNAEGNTSIKNLKIKDEVQSVGETKMNTRLVKSLAEGNATVKNLKIKDDLQIFCLTEVDAEASEDIADGNLNVENTRFLGKVQSTFYSKMDTEPTVNTSEGIVTGKRTKKQKEIVKEETDDEVPSKMDTINLTRGSATTKKPKIKDVSSTENLAQGNMNVENPKIQDESQSMYRTNLDAGPAQSFTLGIVAGKRKKKRRKKKKPVDDVLKETDARLTGEIDEGNLFIENPKADDEFRSLGQIQMNSEPTVNFADGNVILEYPKIQDDAQRMDQKKMATFLPVENLSQGNVSGKRRKKRKKSKNAKVNDEVRRSTENLFDGNVVLVNLKNQDEFPSMDQHKMDTWWPAENLSPGDGPGKQRKKQKKKDEVQRVSQVQMDPGSTENVAEGNVTIRKPKSQDEVQSIYQAKKGTTRLTQNIAEGNVTAKRKMRRRKTKKAKTLDEVPGRMDVGSTENLAGITVCVRTPETRDEVQSLDLKVMDAGSTEDLLKERVNNANPKNIEEDERLDKVKMDIEQAKDFTQVLVNENRKKKRRSTKNSKNVCESTCKVGNMLSFSVSGPIQVSNEVSLDEAVSHAERRSAISTSNVFTIKDADALRLSTTLIASIRRKLLVLDINGLLADIVYPAPKNFTGDIKICGRAVFRRPFCDDFLKFCFQNFDVAVWSSRSKKIVDKVVDYLLVDQKDKLQFCWDMTHSTQTGFKTLENRHKPLVCKELRKIWESDDPNCPWRRGDYDESNTLLLDDSPYKALLNPLHTAIFPSPYQYSFENDNSLGPGGDLRVYLEGLVTSENVQKYVEQHPFGQGPITEQNLSWGFYEQVLEQMSNPVTDKTLIPS